MTLSDATPWRKRAMEKIKRIPLLFLLVCGCTAPHYIWSQKDIGFHEFNPPTLEKKMLVASRDSEFKRKLIDRITDAYQHQPVYIKVIGIERLAAEDANAYSAVVIINTAMGWTVDVPVEQFLKRYGEMKSIIVLTTADGGDVLPDMENRSIDAMSSASVMNQARSLADTIIAKVARLMD
jgi:Ni,Fe-hydrogenase III large subunit